MEPFSFNCIKLTGHKRVFDLLMNNKATNLTKPEQHCDFQNTLRETTTRCMKPFEKRKKYIRHHEQIPKNTIHSKISFCCMVALVLKK